MLAFRHATKLQAIKRLRAALEDSTEQSETTSNSFWRVLQTLPKRAAALELVQGPHVRLQHIFLTIQEVSGSVKEERVAKQLEKVDKEYMKRGKTKRINGRKERESA